MPKESNHWDLVRLGEFYPGLSTSNSGGPGQKRTVSLVVVLSSV